MPPKTNAGSPSENVLLPAAPATGEAASATTTSAPPAEVVGFVVVPTAPPSASPAATGSSPATPAKSAAPAGGRFEAAQILERTLPALPPLARQLRAFGMVRLEVRIDEHGQVKGLKVLSGHPVLAAAAKDAVPKWKFKAAMLDGQPIASNLTVQLSFSQGEK